MIMKIAFGLPAPQEVPYQLISNILSLISYTKENVPNLETVSFMAQAGVRTDRNRNLILSKALEKSIDYIVWLDADMLYPADMVVKYLKWKFDVIGCLYFKRESPFDTVAFIKNPRKNPNKPYASVHPPDLQEKTVIEVDGLGFGGMMVNMKVYDKLGDKKWMKYGDNFHLPFEATNKLSHDLEFCKTAQEAGFKIHLHTGVKPGHIATRIVTEDDWYSVRKPKEIGSEDKITVLMPATDMKQAKKTAKLLKSRAGMKCEVVIAEDKEKSGFVATINEAVLKYPSDYYVYVAQDAFPGRNWLKIAYEAMVAQKAGLLGFNDGKWNGSLASFGMVSEVFRKQLPYVFMHEGYQSHYGDVELTLFARYMNQYVYTPDAVLMEVDYKKDAGSVNEKDRDLFNQRKQTLFPAELQGLFS